MGIERIILADSENRPDWLGILQRLASLGDQATLRMIDGLPAFPDEQPGNEWSELRLSLSGGMVTIRRVPEGYRCVTWGNSSDALRESWNRLTLALGQITQGQIQEGPTTESTEDFAKRVGIAFT